MCVLITITTLSLIFLAGSSGPGTLIFNYDTLRRRVGDAVPDASRRDRALATLDTMEEEAKTHIQGVFDSMDEAREQMKAFDSDLDRIESESILPLDERRTQFFMKMLDYRFELKDSLLEDEWNEVFAPAA